MRYHLQHIRLFVREYVKINFNIRLVTTTEKVQCKQELCNRKSNRGGKIAKLPQPLISLDSFKFAWLPQSDGWFSPASRLNFHLKMIFSKCLALLLLVGTLRLGQGTKRFGSNCFEANPNSCHICCKPFIGRGNKSLIEVHRSTHPQNCILPCCVAFLCQFVQCNWWSVPEGSKGRKL